ncbi:hypothetical protein SLE2022_393910 [Rubroshorea leprosula]
MMAAPTKFMLMLFSLLLWQSFTFADQVPPSPKENEYPLAAIGSTLYGRKLGAASAGFRLTCPSGCVPYPSPLQQYAGKGNGLE